MPAMRARHSSALALSVVLAAGVAAIASTGVGAKKSVPFIDDDYTKAVAEAKARKVPLFIESWAPW